jgi:hypothetical protein
MVCLYLYDIFTAVVYTSIKIEYVEQTIYTKKFSKLYSFSSTAYIAILLGDIGSLWKSRFLGSLPNKSFAYLFLNVDPAAAGMMYVDVHPA